MSEISKTADHALAALEKLSESGSMTTAELAQALGLNRTIVHRLVTTLHQRGYIVRRNDGYALGALLVRMADKVEPELRAAAAEVMRDLAADTGETVVVHVADGEDAVVLDQVVGTEHLVRVEHKIGSRHSLLRAASGRALLAFMDDRAAKTILNRASKPNGFDRTLASVRELGYAISHDELQQGVYGLAVPLRVPEGDAVASLAILIPTSRANGIAEYTPTLLGAAERIGNKLAA